MREDLEEVRILIVDDNQKILNLLERHLCDLGYTVVGRAKNGKEAIKKARDLKPNIITMDIGLPGEIDGIDAAIIIRREIDTAIIFITIQTNDEIFERAKICGPSGFILKPFELKELMITIEFARYNKYLRNVKTDKIDNLKKALKLITNFQKEISSLSEEEISLRPRVMCQFESVDEFNQFSIEILKMKNVAIENIFTIGEKIIISVSVYPKGIRKLM